MWKLQCVTMLLLGVAFVNSAPVQDFYTGFENDDLTGEYDTHSGYFTYGVDSDLVNKKPLSTYISIENQPDNLLDNDKDSSEEGYLTLERLHCPEGQIYQSELSICIDYLYILGDASANQNIPAPGTMLSDAPAIVAAANQKAPSSIISITKEKINHGCKLSETYLSELDLCLTEPPQKAPVSGSKYSDTIAKVPAAQHKAPSYGTVLSVVKIDYVNRCKNNEIYISELDICYSEN